MEYKRREYSSLCAPDMEMARNWNKLRYQEIGLKEWMVQRIGRSSVRFSPKDRAWLLLS